MSDVPTFQAKVIHRTISTIFSKLVSVAWRTTNFRRVVLHTDEPPYSYTTTANIAYNTSSPVRTKPFRSWPRGRYIVLPLVDRAGKTQLLQTTPDHEIGYIVLPPISIG